MMLSYGVASVSGSVLAVCSCTVLPLFAGIWKRGAGLGPAIAFLYSGPAINVLAIILTARILGPEIGAARAVGAVIFSIVIGLFMHLMFRKEEAAKAAAIVAVLIPTVLIPHQPLVAFSVGLIAFVSLLTTTRGETESWFNASWDFARQIMPLLLAGVLVAGLLLAGPALSLPNMLVIHSVLGTRKTAAFVTLVVVMATISGLIFGHYF